MKNYYLILIFFFFAFLPEGKSQVVNAWINEFHYDNDGTDANESAEILVKRADTLDLGLLVITKYNGSGGVVYGSDTVSTFTVGDTVGDFYLFSIVYPSNGLQNGAPDGLALSYNGALIQFISYEGSFDATAGPAIGVTSTDIGVSQSTTEPVGTSLQLVGYDTTYSGLTWVGRVTASLGSVNANQTIGVDTLAPVFDAGYPNASAVADNKFNLNVRMNEAGKVFYVVLANGSPAPDVATVKAGDTLLVNNIATDTTVIVTGLAHGTSYDVYVVAEDNAAGLNTQSSVSLVEVTTLLARTLNLLEPLNEATLILSDTSWFEFEATLIDSVAFWYYNPLVSSFVKAGNNFSASLDSVLVILPQSFSYFDSIQVYLADAIDPTFTSDTNLYFLLDNQSPVYTSLFPQNNSVITGNETFRIEFNEYVLDGSNDSIMIYRRADSTLFDVLHVDTDSVWVSHITAGNSITSGLNFIPNQSFESATSYYVLISEGAVTDKQNNPFQLFNDTVWNFTTLSQELFFSEYIEGSGNNKALEILNPTADTVLLADYRIAQSSNGGGWSYYHTFPANAYIAPGQVWVIAANEVSAAYYDTAMAQEVLSYPSVVHFTGDDARALQHSFDGGTSWVDIDIIGIPTSDPGNGWAVAGVSEATYNHTLLRKVSVTTGNSDWSLSAGTNADDSEWKVFPQNTFGNLGLPTPIASSAAEVLTFSIPGISSLTDIYPEGDSIRCHVIFSAQLDSLYPVFTLSEGASSVPASGDSIDFSTLSSTITVTAEDGVTAAVWTIYITQAASALTENDILDISFAEEAADPIIDTTNHTIEVLLQYGTERDSLVPQLVLSPGATSVPTSGTITDFTADTTLIVVTAENGLVQEWKILVSEYIIDVANLAEFRSYLGSGATFRITGEVVLTAQMSFQNKKYLQDSTAAILVYDPSGIITTSYSEGDGITNLVGTITSYRDVVELVPLVDPGAASSTQNSISVQTISISEFKNNLAQYESELIRIAPVQFENAGANFANGTNYDIYLGTDTTICRVDFYSTDLTGTAIPDSASVTGIAGRYFSTAQLFPRYKADVVELFPVIPPSTVADLNFIKVDGVNIEGFDKDQLNYTSLVAYSATQVPVVTYELADQSASAVLTNAASLPGVATIEVTAEDGETTKTYSVTFEKQANGISQKSDDEVTLYPLPVSNLLFIKNTQSFSRLEVINLTGRRVYEINTGGAETEKIDVSGWNSGMYILRLISGNEIVTKRFIVN